MVYLLKIYKMKVKENLLVPLDLGKTQVKVLLYSGKMHGSQNQG